MSPPLKLSPRTRGPRTSSPPGQLVLESRTARPPTFIMRRRLYSIICSCFTQRGTISVLVGSCSWGGGGGHAVLGPAVPPRQLVLGPRVQQKADSGLALVEEGGHGFIRIHQDQVAQFFTVRFEDSRPALCRSSDEVRARESGVIKFWGPPGPISPGWGPLWREICAYSLRVYRPVRQCSCQ